MRSEPVFRLLTNMLAKFRPLIEQAAVESGFPVFCRDRTEDRSGHILPGYFSVWTSAPHKDLAPFWDAYRRLKAEREAES